MTLRKTTILAICLSFIALFLVMYGLSDTVILDKFEKVERNQAKEHLVRSERAVAAYIDRLDAYLADWSWWDDTYEFVLTQDPEFVKSNLPWDVFSLQDLNVIAFYDVAGNMVWGAFYDLESEAFVALPKEIENLFHRRPELLKTGEKDVFHGILDLPKGAFIAACDEILNSDLEGPSRGFMLMARLLDGSFVDKMAEMTQLDLDIAAFDPINDRFTPVSEPSITLTENTVSASAALLNLAGNPSRRLTVNIPRDIFRVGMQASRMNMAVIAGCILLLGALIILFLEKRILRRVSALSGQVKTAGDKAHPVAVALEGKDELAGLAHEIHGLLTSLRENEDFMETILSTLQVGVVLVETNSRVITEANPYACRMIGLAREQLVGRHCSEVLCPSHAGECPILTGEEGSVCDRKLFRPDGSTVSVLKSVELIYRRNTEHILETFVDVTELEKARAELAASEEKYRTIFMNTGTASILVDEAGLIQLANSEFFRLASVSQEKLSQGIDWFRFFHPDDLPRIKEYYKFRRNSPEQAPHGFRTRFVDSRGRIRSVNMTVAQIPMTRLSVASIEDITDRVAAEEKLAYKAFYDSLTGLPNRQLFSDHLKRSIARAERHGGQIGVMLLDLDGFKHVNDSLGHPAGDEVLKKVSARLQNILRRSDSLARLGGDEFTLVVDDMEDPSDLSTVAENLLENFKKPFQIQETDIYLGASIGIAVYPLDGDTPEKLVQNADLAMYKSKEQGKNTFNHYTSGLNAQARQRLQLESELRRALSENVLQVYFQPKVNLNDWRIYSAEALVRWPDENGGFRNTSEFIHFAESTGLIIPLDRYVFEKACRTAKKWVEKGNDALRLSVNVSTRHFKRGDLADNISEVLEATGFPAERLNLEITETALMTNLQSASATLIELNSMGVTFSLDDFGTGYSSLYYLKTLPVQSLKIDKRFISLIESQSTDGDIFVKTILSMADNLGLNTVAEGVETKKQLDILTKLGCKRAQGYLFSPAVSAEEFERLLSKGRIVPGRDKVTPMEKKPANLFKIK